MLTYLLLAAAVAAGLAWRARRREASPPRPAPPTSPPSASPPLRTVEETVSAVLRRQVPVRFDEPPRSWLGGLPRLPDDVPWPTAARTDHPELGERPLHFVAQVACADLPPALWGGLGPREGWLLVFLDGWTWEGLIDGRGVRVLHVPTLGSERQPPAGMLPTRDEGYTGYDTSYYRSQDDVPPTWRRWPVDVVSVPNRPVQGAESPTIIPPDFASLLYDGAPVSGDRHRPRPRRTPPEEAEWPYTWGGALHVVDAVIRVVSRQRPVPASVDRNAAAIEAPGWVGATVAAIDAASVEMARRRATLPPSGDTAAVAAALDQSVAQLVRMRDYLHDGSAPIAPAVLLARLREERERHAAWLGSRGPVLDRLRAEVLARDLHAPMSADEFRPILDALATDGVEYWAMVRGGTLDRAAPTPIATSLAAFAARGFEAALTEVAADLYVASPELRGRIPAPVLARCEPHWRALVDDRAHRMGGLHDGVQSTATPGPTSRVLLLQLASDDAMQWCWGDLGAYYLWIDVARLAAHDFSAVEAMLECH